MQIENEEWLKTAFLSWRKINRIAPERELQIDSESVKMLLGETDFLESSYPSGEELDLISMEFIEFVHSNSSGLLRRFCVSDAEQEASHKYIQQFHTPGLNDGRSYIYAGTRGKMSEVLAEELHSFGLAQHVHEGYIALSPPLAWTYISRLAQIMSEKRGFSPITERIDAHRALESWDAAGILTRMLTRNSSGNNESSDRTSSAYVGLVLEDVFPANLNGVPWSKLIKFRKKTRSELAAFHHHIETLNKTLSALDAIEDAGALRDHLNVVYERETRPLLDELRRSYRSSGIDLLGGSMAVKIDSTSVAGTALGTGLVLAGGSSILTAAGFAAAIVPSVVATGRAISKKRRESPAAYLLSLEKLNRRAIFG